MSIKSVFVSKEKSGELDSALLLFFLTEQILFIYNTEKWLALSVKKNGVIIVEILNIQENLYHMSTILTL